MSAAFLERKKNFDANAAEIEETCQAILSQHQEDCMITLAVKSWDNAVHINKIYVGSSQDKDLLELDQNTYMRLKTSCMP